MQHYMLHAICYMPYAICYMLYAIYHMNTTLHYTIMILYYAILYYTVSYRTTISCVLYYMSNIIYTIYDMFTVHHALHHTYYPVGYYPLPSGLLPTTYHHQLYPLHPINIFSAKPHHFLFISTPNSIELYHSTSHSHSNNDIKNY